VSGISRLESLHVVTRPASERGVASAADPQAEILRKMLLAMVQDIRTVLIKLAQELVTLRTLTRHPDEALRQRHARVTLDLFAPLANRLGIWQIKWELEDLSFRFLQPAEYQRMARLVDETRAGREHSVQAARAELLALLARPGASALALTTMQIGVALALPAGASWAQDFPKRQITMVVPFAAGGSTDLVARLLAQGPDAFLKKIGEEATEVVMAAKDADHGADTAAIVAEVADLWFHCLIALAHYGLNPAQVLAELARRADTSGLEEKALRKAHQRSDDENRAKL
jgi:phosphoribosyl-ATP pyrophosphohydrolase